MNPVGSSCRVSRGAEAELAANETDSDALRGSIGGCDHNGRDGGGTYTEVPAVGPLKEGRQAGLDMMRPTILLSAVLAAVALAACGADDDVAPQRAGEQSPDAGERAAERPEIAFSRAGGKFSLSIYVMNADGGGRVRLTDDSEAVDTDPAFSPDGEWIAFTRQEGRESRTYLIESDGADVTQLTDGRDDSQPAWSPDGERIVFRRAEGSLYIMEADGSDAAQLTDGPDDSQPAWSPDGERIVFNRERPLKGDPAAAEGGIYATNADGSGPVNLSDGPAFDEFNSSPAFSPDGRRIAFLARGLGEETAHVWLMGAHGSDPAPLDGTRSAPFSPPAFSPDGKRIVFVGGREGGIHVMNAGGSDPTRLTRRIDDMGPAWSPAAAKSP